MAQGKESDGPPSCPFQANSTPASSGTEAPCEIHLQWFPLGNENTLTQGHTRIWDRVAWGAVLDSNCHWDEMRSLL